VLAVAMLLAITLTLVGLVLSTRGADSTSVSAIPDGLATSTPRTTTN